MSAQDNTRILAEPAHKTAQIAEAERKVIEAARAHLAARGEFTFLALAMRIRDLDELQAGVTLQEITAEEPSRP